MMNVKHPGTMVAGLVFMIIGAAYLLEAFDVWDVHFRIWPIFLIAVGVVILLGGRATAPDEPPPDDE
jgi:fucose permease